MRDPQQMTVTAPDSSTSRPALCPDGAPVPVRWVEELFSRLAGILGSSMSNVYASADPDVVKAEWAEGLAGFSPDEIRRGLDATRVRKFPPNLPDFLHLCRPALDPEVAWIEAEKGMRAHGQRVRFEWSHPAVYWAAREMQHEIRVGPFVAHRKRWEAALTATWALRAWPEVPDPTLRAIEHRPRPGIADPVRRDAIVARLHEQRLRMTGFATRAEQDAALHRAEDQALQQPIDQEPTP